MKKILLNYKLIGMSVALFLAVGCKDTLDINTSPNNPSLETATPEVLFPSAVMSTAGRVGGDLSIVGGMWAQFWTQNNNSSQFRSVDAYDLANTSTFVNSAYNELFVGALTDYQLGITKAQAAQDWRYNLMNTVMKAYTYEVLADLYDQVPYTEALKASDGVIQPKFDDGYTVYKGVLGEIDAALAKDFTSAPFSDDQAKTDFVFGGDMEKWVQFANTLKLKMYLRMVNAKPDEAQAGIKALIDGGAKFLDVNAGVNNFVDVPNSSNPFYEYNFRRLNTPDNLKASNTFLSWLKKNSDPRLAVYFGSADAKGINQGDYLGGAAHPEYNQATNVVVKATDAVWFITAAESYFMQAEALERYYGGAGAQAMYEAGVNAAFADRGVSATSLLTGAYAYPTNGSFDAKLQAIITQKWASLFGSHALEAFFEKNRTGYPLTSAVYSTDPAYVAGEIVTPPNAVTGPGTFPQRFVFPNNEKSRNSNTPAEVPITTKVWWAK